MKNSAPKIYLLPAGFTIVELLVVVVIIGILFGIGVAQYMNFNRSQILEQAAQELKNNLRLAQAKAANGEKPLGCIALDGYRVIFFSGNAGNPDTYQIRAICGGNEMEEVKTFSLPSKVRFSPLPSPILFKVLAQGTDLNSDLIIFLTAFEKTKTIIVTQQGKIE